MSLVSDPALETLLLPFASGDLAWPVVGTIRFFGARDGWPLRQFPLHSLVCEQVFKPHADALARGGLRVFAPDDGDGDDASRVAADHVAAGRTDGDQGGDQRAARDALVLVLPPRQREQARASLARAVLRATPGGRVVMCVPNSEGAKAAQADLMRLAGSVEVRTKNHARVIWTAPLREVAHDAALLATWLHLDAPRPILDGRFVSRPGVFAWDRIDPASALLADHLPTDLRGRCADLGAGWGFLSDAVLRRNPGVDALDLFEADARALALARRNLAAFDGVALGFHWHDVPSGLPAGYDAIVSNPPFHATGGDARPDIGRAFIVAASRALRSGGRFWLVANRQLPYEDTLGAAFSRVTTHAQRDGFKIIEAVKAA